MGMFSELKLAVPWGHIAAKVWGSQQGFPVLCLHGWLDNANSFDRLIPLLPKDFQYVAMDFGGHGLSSHYSPGLPYYQQNFVSEIRRVTAALKWNRFSLMGHSFGGIVGGTFSCLFPEMVDKLILLDSSPLTLDSKEINNLLTYKRKAIERLLQVEASKKPPQVVSPEEMLQGLLKNNRHVGEECGKLLLQRGATQEAAGLPHQLDSLQSGSALTLSTGKKEAASQTQHCLEFISRELFVHSISKLQAHVLLIKATQGYYDVRGENDADKDFVLFLTSTLKSALRERFQFVEVPGNHYIHMNQPQLVAGLISSFLQSGERTPEQPEPCPETSCSSHCDLPGPKP